MLSFERERAFLGPGADHQIMGFVEPLVADRRVGAHGIVFGADAADHAADQPPAGDAVDHGVFFRQGQGVFADAERIAEHRDLHLRCPPRQRRGRDDRRRHQAIGILVMFVHAQPVEAELFAHLQFVEIGVVQVVAHLRIEVRIGIHHPGRLVLLVVIEIETGIGHKMEQKTLHGRFPN